MEKDIPPQLKLPAFICPHCGVYAHQNWRFEARAIFNDRECDPESFGISTCTHCGGYILWHLGKMLYPEDAGIAMPNVDLDEAIKEDYNEAKGILNRSPRGAAALLRLCVQKLCKQLGESGENINNDIANLVDKGLPKTIQKALDIVRVIGNESVHPGQMDLKDDRETALELFKLINMIADVMISQPKAISELYMTLPEDKRDAIEKRDS